jgi:hypothetical protein
MAVQNDSSVRTIEQKRKDRHAKGARKGSRSKAKPSRIGAEGIRGELEPADMSRDEARKLTDRVKWDMVAVGEKLRQLHDRRGWKALGHGSWESYIKHEFGYTRQWAYLQIQAAEVRDALSTQVDDLDVERINERQVRELRKLEPKQRVRVAERVKERGGFATLQASQVRLIVREVGGARKSPPPTRSPLDPLTHMIQSGLAIDTVAILETLEESDSECASLGDDLDEV